MPLFGQIPTLMTYDSSLLVPRLGSNRSAMGTKSQRVDYLIAMRLECKRITVDAKTEYYRNSVF